MSRKSVYIIGAGPGGEALLTGEARNALGRCEFVLGAERILESFAALIHGKNAKSLTSGGAIVEALRESACTVSTVLVSGDSGFFSLSKRLSAMLEAEGWKTRILCGISSLAYFAARLGVSYDDAAIDSLHGRLKSGSAENERLRALNRVAGLVAQNQKCFFLTDGVLSPKTICLALVERGMGNVRINIGERLSHPDEKISSYTAKDAQKIDFDEPNVIFISNHAAKSVFPGFLRDSDFERGEVPMTKEEIRAVSMAKLRVRRDSVCWDVGAGTGSVSCAMALAAPFGVVYAVERNAEAVALLQKNKLKFGLHNIEIVNGMAPAALSSLPDPDLAFVGGTGGALRPVLTEILARDTGIRVVINAITLETLAEVRSITLEKGLPDVEIVQIGVNFIQKAGDYSILKARNPVFVISFGGLDDAAS
ncbi:MAG: precorrin-6y C5,15-methyltransferase (decarboxylating) subunit CbiE [Spirochaetaceae bacterium]|jgi:precorrin-6Y C5,15-methyltransferase (decarboxylating)|nr:precorrin-6y C5,15-methyltransferase (decarboxylating) subunit CbiE [Spirochaetaceae bacterium]